jgi:hypothetical protein
MRILGLVFASAFLASCQSTPAPPYKPVADVKLLMQALDPQADIVWQSAKTVITDHGTEEIGPKTAAEWTAVRNAAVLLAESGNLLMMPPRAQAGSEWMRAARALVDASEAAIRAADAHDRERLFEIGGDITDVCMSCHYHYDPAVKASRAAGSQQ